MELLERVVQENVVITEIEYEKVSVYLCFLLLIGSPDFQLGDSLRVFWRSRIYEIIPSSCYSL